MRLRSIDLATGLKLKVGKGLRSCTTEIRPTKSFSVNGPKVILLDTPGFDDTQSSNYDILEEITEYMDKFSLALSTETDTRYRKNKLLDGIIYLHYIADRRMGGITVRNLRLYESLCGDDPLKSIRLVTNMLPNAEIGNEREQELRGTQIILVAPLGETEVVDDKLRLNETTAAVELLKGFDSMIQNLERMIAKEGHAVYGESPRALKERERRIKTMKAKVKELEERKMWINQKSGYLRLHVVFLRWVESLFS
ncbi:hypothetical protein CPB86DRAFT_796459 [Serendipita vermifera]|nr:hypothetical protein CPB86DRAFT_796459 [Serendipita vermifera]